MIRSLAFSSDSPSPTGYTHLSSFFDRFWQNPCFLIVAVNVRLRGLEGMVSTLWCPRFEHRKAWGSRFVVVQTGTRLCQSPTNS